ncbi:MAG TPA: protein kinase [Herpetosiphonaceae bacterium]|nr:protein kinase [Herpetosiphonaceae bacterium]
MHDPLIGQRVDTYEIRSLLGSGGMAQVYRAFEPLLKREVALKILSGPMQRQPAFADRFVQEGRLLASFQHPGIVHIYNIGEYQGMPYLVQELLPGPTLEEELAAAHAAGRRLDAATVIDIVAQVAGALDYAHARGIVHRDLKPSNLMRNAHGAMVLMDFGIAKAVAGAAKLTQTGTVLGTPQYLAPEQASGLPPTAATDIYALGVIIFELATGQVPFNDPSALSVAIAHLSAPPPAPRSLRPDLPAPVEAVILRALAKAPEDRFASAGALAQALAAAWSAPALPINALPTVVSPVTPAERDAARARAGVHNVGTTINPALMQQAQQARAPGPLPQAAPPPILVPRPRPKQNWRIWLAGAGLLAALLVVLVLRNRGTEPSGTDDGTTPTTAAIASTAGATPAEGAEPPIEDVPTAEPAASSPATPAEVIETARDRVTEAAAAGLIDSKIAQDLHKQLDEIEKKLGEGKANEVSKKAVEFQEKLSKELEKGKVDAGVAAELSALMDLLAGADSGGSEEDD